MIEQGRRVLPSLVWSSSSSPVVIPSSARDPLFSSHLAPHTHPVIPSRAGRLCFRFRSCENVGLRREESLCASPSSRPSPLASAQEAGARYDHCWRVAALPPEKSYLLRLFSSCRTFFIPTLCASPSFSFSVPSVASDLTSPSPRPG